MMIDDRVVSQIGAQQESTSLALGGLETTIGLLLEYVAKTAESMKDTDKLLEPYQMQLRQVAGIKLQRADQVKVAVVRRLCRMMNVSVVVENDLVSTWPTEDRLYRIGEKDRETMTKAIEYMNTRFSSYERH